MSARKPFLFRTDPEVFEALQRWAADELRSVNGQIDYLLRHSLRQAGRYPQRAKHDARARERSPDSTASSATTKES